MIKWEKFKSKLFCYINECHNKIVSTDYKINLNMSQIDVLKELTQSKSIDDLSPSLKCVAQQFMNKKK